jgi:hypothetical protein
VNPDFAAAMKADRYLAAHANDPRYLRFTTSKYPDGTYITMNGPCRGIDIPDPVTGAVIASSTADCARYNALAGYASSKTTSKRPTTIGGEWEILRGSYYSGWAGDRPDDRVKNRQENAGFETLKSLGPGHFSANIGLGRVVELHGSDTEATGAGDFVDDSSMGHDEEHVEVKARVSDGKLYLNTFAKRVFVPSYEKDHPQISYREALTIAKPLVR